jgi:hypothetical protein
VKIEFNECVVIAKVDNLTELMNQTSHNQRMLYFFVVSNIAEEIFAHSEFRCEIVDMKGDHLVMILSQAGVVDFEQEEVHVCLRRIQDIVQEYYKLSISMTTSTKMTFHLDITAQYSLTLQYSMYKLLFGKKAIIMPEKVISNHEQTEYHLLPELIRN